MAQFNNYNFFILFMIDNGVFNGLVQKAGENQSSPALNNNYFSADSSLGINSLLILVLLKVFCPNNTRMKLKRLINNS